MLIRKFTNFYVSQLNLRYELSFEEVFMDAVLAISGQYFRHHPRIANFDGFINDMEPLSDQIWCVKNMWELLLEHCTAASKFFRSRKMKHETSS